jgi:hypothetical protein
MPVLGRKWLPREIARLLYDTGWKDAVNLLKMTCTTLAESGGYEWAYHYNDPKDGGNGSTDWGMFELNDGNVGGKAPIVGSDGKPKPVAGGSKSLATVQAFATKALDPNEAVKTARSMYEARGFEPWYGYFNPFNNTSPWKAHIKQAAAGIGNMLDTMFGVPLG